MFKRIFLFLVTNLAIMLALSIIIFVLNNVFGLNLGGGKNATYVGLFGFSLVMGFAGSFISLLMSKWMAKRSYDIQLINGNEFYNLSDKEKLVYQVVKDLAERNHINMPEVGIYDDEDPNAFATGPSKNNSLVAVSTGLLNEMSNSEIEGVIAHEMAHILNGDMVTMTLLQGVLNTFVIFFSRIIAGIADKFLAGDDEESTGSSWVYFLVSIIMEMILGIFASIIAMKFSRYREFRADEGSAKFVGKEKMIQALEALKRMKNLASSDDESLATMKISTKERGGFMALFSSDPDLDDRIDYLKSLSI